MSRNLILKYFIDTYFDSDLDEVSQATGYTNKQLQDWLSGEVIPQNSTINYLVHCIFTPEFKVIVEFAEFDSTEQIKPQLRTIFGSNGTLSGIYAFYDSMGTLLYVGKATNLLEECYSAIRRDIHINFPRGIKTAPEKRYEIVKYISAYDVGISDMLDYPKHVESLILRISKPLFNKNIGRLKPAYKLELDE